MVKSQMARNAFIIVLLLIFSGGCKKERATQEAAKPTADTDGKADLLADTVYTNGKFYTVNEAQPWAEAVAIKDGKFIAVGKNADVEAVKGASTKVIDLGGKFAMPGLLDTHVHIEQAYIGDIVGDQMLTFPVGETSIKKLQEMLKEYADKNSDLDILFAQNLPQDIFPNSAPTKAFIDEVIPDRPVVMLSDTEHEGLLNSRALEMEGITRDSPSPKGGVIDKDANGEPTGYLRETAAGLWAWKHYPKLSPEEHKNGLQATIAYLNTIGVTAVKQQHAKNPIAEAAQSLEKDGDLHARIALSWTWKGPLEPMSLEEQEKMIAERGRFASDMIKTEFVKISLDGNVGTTGYVLEPYLKSKGTGLPVFPNDKDVVAEVEKFDRMGMGITTHSTGDAANRQFLDAIAAVKKEHGVVKGRHQLGHASLIHPNDYPRLRELNVTAEFSPVVWFPTPYSEGVLDELGEERLSRWYPMNSLLKQGGRFTIASDGPLMWQDTFSRLEGAITRMDPDGGTVALAPLEAIDLPAAIRAMTIDSAYMMDLEKEIGSIEIGKHADMVILDKNLFEISPADIDSTKVLQTMFDGELVYDLSDDPTTERAIEQHHDVELDLTGESGHPGCKWHEVHSE